jgi:hypothetical protein
MKVERMVFRLFRHKVPLPPSSKTSTQPSQKDLGEELDNNLSFKAQAYDLNDNFHTLQCKLAIS